MRRLERDHRRLVDALDRALAWARDPGAFGTVAPDVSGWSVGEHLEHLALSDRGILGALETATDPTDPTGAEAPSSHRGGPTWRGPLVLLTGFIPRGRGRAPEFAVPDGVGASKVADDLVGVRADVRALSGRLDALARSRATRRHPALGAFTPAQWIRFAGVHHAHHEKVIRDILASS